MSQDMRHARGDDGCVFEGLPPRAAVAPQTPDSTRSVVCVHVGGTRAQLS